MDVHVEGGFSRSLPRLLVGSLLWTILINDLDEEKDSLLTRGTK